MSKRERATRATPSPRPSVSRGAAAFRARPAFARPLEATAGRSLERLGREAISALLRARSPGPRSSRSCGLLRACRRGASVVAPADAISASIAYGASGASRDPALARPIRSAAQVRQRDASLPSDSSRKPSTPTLITRVFSCFAFAARTRRAPRGSGPRPRVRGALRREPSSTPSARRRARVRSARRARTPCRLARRLRPVPRAERDVDEPPRTPSEAISSPNATASARSASKSGARRAPLVHAQQRERHARAAIAEKSVLRSSSSTARSRTRWVAPARAPTASIGKDIDDEAPVPERSASSSARPASLSAATIPRSGHAWPSSRCTRLRTTSSSSTSSSAARRARRGLEVGARRSSRTRTSARSSPAEAPPASSRRTLSHGDAPELKCASASASFPRVRSTSAPAACARSRARAASPQHSAPRARRVCAAWSSAAATRRRPSVASARCRARASARPSPRPAAGSSSRRAPRLRARTPRASSACAKRIRSLAARAAPRRRPSSALCLGTTARTRTVGSEEERDDEQQLAYVVPN